MKNDKHAWIIVASNVFKIKMLHLTYRVWAKIKVLRFHPKDKSYTCRICEQFYESNASSVSLCIE